MAAKSIRRTENTDLNPLYAPSSQKDQNDRAGGIVQQLHWETSATQAGGARQRNLQKTTGGLRLMTSYRPPQQATQVPSKTLGPIGDITVQRRPHKLLWDSKHLVMMSRCMSRTMKG